ncbi:hypothetical protein V3Q90_08995 [Flavobacterium oreochromis]|uniref:hypothetical protein n=1 Tax=Flavobacterium oreochromis TaxID=2906078 RepID=UPI00385A9287
MDASEANKIDLNKETNVNKLRDLVKYWQDSAISLQNQNISLQNQIASLKSRNSKEEGNSNDFEI